MLEVISVQGSNIDDAIIRTATVVHSERETALICLFQNKSRPVAIAR